MNPFLRSIIVRETIKKHSSSTHRLPELNDFIRAKGARQQRVRVQNRLVGAMLGLGGILSATLGLKGFIIPNGFIDGGATGISLLLTRLTPLPLWVWLLIVNAPFLLLGRKQIGSSFMFKTFLVIAGLSVAVALLPVPAITQDKILAAVFGGFFLGAGIGLAVRGGSVLDGTEVLAIALSRKNGLTIGDHILLINIVIFSVAAYLLSIEIALYSLLTYMSASRTVDFIIEGIEEYIGVNIISPKSREIAQMISEKLGRGITVYRGGYGVGKRGRISEERDIIFTVITRLELSRLKTEIEIIDPNAFVVMHGVKDTKGGMIKKRPMKE